MDLPIEEHEKLRQLEEYMLRPEARRSPERIATVLADDFLEFGRSGRTYDKADALKAIAVLPDGDVSTTDFSTRALAPGVVLVTYRSVWRGRDGGENHSLRSSIWRQTEAGWKVVLHHATPTVLAK